MNVVRRYSTRSLKNATVLRAVTNGETDIAHRRFPQPRLSDGRAFIVWAETATDAKEIYHHWLAERGLTEPRMEVKP